MPFIAYKVKVTLDNGTFVRPMILKIPVCDGITSNIEVRGSQNTSITTIAAAAQVPYSPSITGFINKGDVSLSNALLAMAAGGGPDIADTTASFPSDNMRLVFDDHHYIKLVDYSTNRYIDHYKDGVLTHRSYSYIPHPYFTTAWGNTLGGFETFPWINAQGLEVRYSIDMQFNGTGSEVSFWGCNLLTTYVSGLSDTAKSWYMDLPDPYDENDPYSEIPDSQPTGPAEGTGIPESDPVDFPILPNFSVTDTGFVTLFNPSMSQVKDLADYMWNGLFDLNNFKKIFADPMDCILGFNMVPVAVPSGSAMNISIGNIVTSVSMNVATSQWVELNCGSIDIGLPYGSYLDFSPYTKFSIYLPYIGTCELSADDVAGRVLTLKYHVDALSCACVAYLKCGDHVLYQWTGSCGYSIPITQNDFSRMIMTIVSVAAAGIGGAVVGGAGAAIMSAGANAAKNVSALKPEVHRSGAIGSSAGLMGGQTPYLIIEIPQACKPKTQYHYTGYPGFITVKVGDLTGYAEFEEIILDGIGCTEEERSIIESLCKGGIYV